MSSGHDRVDANIPVLAQPACPPICLHTCLPVHLFNSSFIPRGVLPSSCLSVHSSTDSKTFLQVRSVLGACSPQNMLYCTLWKATQNGTGRTHQHAAFCMSGCYYGRKTCLICGNTPGYASTIWSMQFNFLTVLKLHTKEICPCVVIADPAHIASDPMPMSIAAMEVDFRQMDVV